MTRILPYLATLLACAASPAAAVTLSCAPQDIAGTWQFMQFNRFADNVEHCVWVISAKGEISTTDCDVKGYRGKATVSDKCVVSIRYVQTYSDFDEGRGTIEAWMSGDKTRTDGFMHHRTSRWSADFTTRFWRIR